MAAPRSLFLSAWLTSRALCKCQRRDARRPAPVWPFAAALVIWFGCMFVARVLGWR
jgi:hypothetical protein